MHINEKRHSRGYPKIKVKFHVNGTDTTSLSIDAVNTVGTPWSLQNKPVYFDGFGWSTGDADNYVTFDSESLETIPATVGKHTVYWSWRVTAVGGVPRTPYVFASTNHTFYTLYDDLKAPWDQVDDKPYEEIIDKACTWADNQSNETTIRTRITQNIYNNLGDQDGDIDYYWPGGINRFSSGTYNNNFYVEDFLDSLSISSSVVVNCSDMANIVAAYTTIIGLATGSKILHGSGDTNDIDPIGDNRSWSIATWNSYHQFAHTSTNKIYDACLRLNQASPFVPVDMMQNTYDSYLGYSYTNTDILSNIYLMY